jgi:hypothetical protein
MTAAAAAAGQTFSTQNSPRTNSQHQHENQNPPHNQPREQLQQLQMNNPHPQPFTPGSARPQNGRALQNRQSGEFRNNGAPQAAVNGNGPMPVPALPRGPVGNGQSGFAGARSPPSA